MIKEKFVIIEFPEIQELQDISGFEKNAFLINNDEGLEKYGGSAYFVNEVWLNANIKI